VTDSSGSAVPKVQIVVTEESTNTATRTESNDSGDYNVSYLKPGSWKVSFSAAGFKEHVENGVQLQIKSDVIAVAKETGAKIYVDRLGPADNPATWQEAIDQGADGIQTTLKSWLSSLAKWATENPGRFSNQAERTKRVARNSSTLFSEQHRKKIVASHGIRTDRLPILKSRFSGIQGRLHFC
jgi:hypothetical protein